MRWSSRWLVLVFLGLVAVSCGGGPDVASDDDDEDGGSSGSGGSVVSGGSGGGAAASSGGSGGSTGGSGGAQGGSGGSVGGSGGSTGGSDGSVGGAGGSFGGGTGGAGGSVGGTGGTGGSVGGSGGTGGSVGGAGGAGGSVGGAGGSVGGTGGTGGGGTGGSSGSGGLEEVPEACVLVTSCSGCCVTVGAYALDPLDADVTASRVTSLTYDGVVGVIANYSFQAPNETGGIFFRLDAEVSMEYLSLAVGTSGEALEAALVRGGGVDGCIYPMVGNTLSSIPSACWGLGAGPYYGIPVDQIEIRIRSSAAQPGLLQVSDVYFY